MIYEPRRVSRHRRRPKYVLYVLILLVVAGGYWLLSGPGKPASVTPKPGASSAPAVTPPAGQTTPQQPAQPPAASAPKTPPPQEPAPSAPAPADEPVRTPTTQPSEKPKRPAPVSPPPQPAPEEPKTQPKPLEVLDWRFVSDQNSRFLEGTIKDNANINYQYVQVEVTLYDEVGRYLGTRTVSTITSGGWLQAGGTWKFRLLITDARAVKCSFNLSGR